MKKTLLFLCFLATCVPLLAQQSRLLPDEYFNRNDTSWYNRKTGSSLHFVSLINGNYDQAIAFAKTQLPDLEAEFILAVGYAAKGDADSAMMYVRSSLEKQLPLGRYLAGDLEVMQPLLELAAFKKMIEATKPAILHGPMVGDVSARMANIWFRTYQEQLCEIELSRSKDFKKIDKSFSAQTTAAKEFTTVAKLTGLKPNTTYYYRVKAQGAETYFSGSFTTFPKANKANQFSIIFGGGAAFIPWRHQMWSTIYSHRPDALFMMGDNVYIDYPEVPQAQLYCYFQRQSEPQWRRMIANTPIYAIWDDHDFG
ncbi:MAG: PhoD-like phosphatase N-terminal domain-containing protein, partial [Bacteroidota bacterium]